VASDEYPDNETARILSAAIGKPDNVMHSTKEELMHTQISITTPADFNFGYTVNSHGWERLEPFSLNREQQVLTRIERLPSQLSRLEIAHNDTIDVTVRSDNQLTKEDRAYITEFIAYCFAFNWDLSKCYSKVAGDATYSFIKEQRLGRLLLAPSMWENLVKTQFLTNTHARHTTAMAAKFCTLGDSFGDRYAFPTPAQVLAKSLDELERQTGTGYRAKYIRSLAEAITSGFDPESLRNSSLSYEDIYERVRALHGFGDYSASYVLKLLGRFERISIDTVMRRYFKEIAGKENATDSDITAYYERFDECKGLVAWWEVSHRADAKGELSF
jgi:3-methyladenine DNA glycosylase/8-oxoguanine DNA glycosylase